MAPTNDARIEPPIQLLNLRSALTADDMTFNFMLWNKIEE